MVHDELLALIEMCTEHLLCSVVVVDYRFLVYLCCGNIKAVLFKNFLSFSMRVLLFRSQSSYHRSKRRM